MVIGSYHKVALSFLGLGLLSVFVFLPALFSPYLQSHDFIYHVIFNHHFTSQLAMGEWYPRWLYAMNDGFGSPAFFYYAPLPYYITAGITAILGLDSSSPYPLIASAIIALCASGVTMYLWCRRFTSISVSIVLATVYMLLPYHLVVDGYLRFAFSEFWAFVWMPLILVFSHDLGLGRADRTVWFVLAVTALLITHLPTAVIFLPILIPMWWVTTIKGYRWKSFLLHLLGGLLAMGISAIYWVPALSLQPYVSIFNMFNGMFLFRNNFLFSGPVYGHNLFFWRYITFISFMLLLVVLSAVSLSRYSAHRTSKPMLYFWLAIACMALTMMLPMSLFVWELVPPIQSIQFPWRFNSILCVAAVTVFALVIGHQDRWEWVKQGLFFYRFGLMSVVILIFGTLIYAAEPVLFKRMTAENFSMAMTVSRSPLEYRPHWVPSERFTKQEIVKFSDITPVMLSKNSVIRWMFHFWSPREVEFDVDVPEKTEFTVHQFYFPGWKGYTTETKEPLLLSRDKNGLISFELPAGQQTVHLELTRLKEERFGIWMTSICAVIWVGMALVTFWMKQRQRRNNKARSITT